MTARYIVGDALEVLATLEPASVDLIVTSPPFLALRSYLPADHPAKGKELGSEATPGAFIDRLLDVVEACARVLAPHGSLVFELGDTYAGNGSATTVDGERRQRVHNLYNTENRYSDDWNIGNTVGKSHMSYETGGKGWPLDKSKVLIPQLFAIALAYGFNPLTGRQTEPWRVRNTVAWCRPNPPVGRDGDKFRPATSFLTVACKARDRYWDGDAVRVPYADITVNNGPKIASNEGTEHGPKSEHEHGSWIQTRKLTHAGAPLLDYWVIPTSPYRGAWQGDTLYRASRDCPEHSLRAIRQRLQTAGDGELREALLRNSRRTDAGPALKPTCVRYANMDLDSQARREMQDWLDQSIRSEQKTESNAASRTPAPNLGGSPSVDARTVGRTSRMPAPPTSTDQTTLTLNLEHAPPATPRSKASSKTDPAPATSPSGMPSAETPGDTEHTSTSPASSSPRPDTSASSTSADGSDEDHPQTQVRIADRCTCEQYTESGSHYATYPPDLVVPLVKSMCPARVCRVCGKPSTRIVGEAEYVQTRNGGAPAVLDKRAGERVADGVNGWDTAGMGDSSVTRSAPTLGWSDCGCTIPAVVPQQPAGSAQTAATSGGGGSKWRPGLVLDPFAGSGTTLAVATGHGFDCIGIDLDERNADLARQRAGMFLDVEVLAYGESI